MLVLSSEEHYDDRGNVLDAGVTFLFGLAELPDEYYTDSFWAGNVALVKGEEKKQEHNGCS